MTPNQGVLAPEFTPPDLQHRDTELERLQRALRVTDPDDPGRLATIFGPSGAGKTTLATHLTRQFTSEPGRKSGYADCFDEKTPTRVLQQLLRDTGVCPVRPPATTAACLTALRECPDSILLVIDEVSHLTDAHFIEPLIHTRHVGLILVDRDAYETFIRLPDGVRDRVMTAPTIRLSPYTTGELEDILWRRVELGGDPSMITRSAVRAIAAWAGSSAYRAVALLRECIMHADFTVREQLTREDVKEIAAGFVPVPPELGTHERQLYTLIREAESVDAGELKQRYEAHTPAPRGDSMRRRYLQRLEERGLITATGSTSGKRYHLEDP